MAESVYMDPKKRGGSTGSSGGGQVRMEAPPNSRPQQGVVEQEVEGNSMPEPPAPPPPPPPSPSKVPDSLYLPPQRK